MESQSPPRSICCFWYSSQKTNRKKGKGDGISGFDIKDNGNWGKNDEMLSDMSTFSVKEQERRMKKAMEEEQRVSREAERMVQWVRQESARMDAAAITSILREEHESIK